MLERFVAWPKVDEVLVRGENKASAKVGRDGLQVDVRALPRESYGAALQYFTGSKDHNVAIRAARRQNGTHAQRVRAVPPRRQHARWPARPRKRCTTRWGWIGFRRSCARIWARSTARPSIGCRSCWNFRDMRGDIHMHTTETDGRASLEEMAAAARAQGLRVHRHHRPFQGAGHGERPGRGARGGLRADTCAS